MVYRRWYAALVVALAFAGLVAAQESACHVKFADLPEAAEWRGFRLRMTPDQLKARVPQVAFGRTNDLGVSRTSINPDFDPRIDKSNFADVRTVSLDFLDARVTSLWIGFNSSFKWKTVDEFVKGISAELALPDEWTMKGRGQELKCADFRLSVSPIGGGPSLRIVDVPAEETLLARRQAKEDESSAAEEATSEAAPVSGDVRKKIYYPTGCEALKSVPDKSRVSFGSQQEAEKAGYKRADDCH